MAEKLIGSLIYGEHEIPKLQQPWPKRIRLPLAIVIGVFLIIWGAYKLVNFREEGSVSGFLTSVRSGNYDTAYAKWDVEGGDYDMTKFVEDWGRDGYYGKSADTATVSESHTSGKSVIVYVKFEGFKTPIAFLVDKESLKISFSPFNKYVKTKKYVS